MTYYEASLQIERFSLSSKGEWELYRTTHEDVTMGEPSIDCIEEVVYNWRPLWAIGEVVLIPTFPGMFRYIDWDNPAKNSRKVVITITVYEITRRRYEVPDDT